MGLTTDSAVSSYVKGATVLGSGKVTVPFTGTYHLSISIQDTVAANIGLVLMDDGVTSTNLGFYDSTASETGCTMQRIIDLD